MAQQIQELLDKIKSDGFGVAEKKAQAVEQDARKKAEDIVNQAKKESDRILIEAKSSIKKMEEAARTALKHASRNTLLSLKKEIQQTLHRMIVKDIGDTLTPEHLGHILEILVKKFADQGHEEVKIQIAISPKDLETLKQGFLARLQKQLKVSLTIKTSEDISKGFMVSFDAGKSSFDFTDKALAEYVGTYLNEEVASLVKESV
jgi:V/A-type H+-transporting ATPase subunit E